MSHYNDISIKNFLTNEFSHIELGPAALLLDLGCGDMPYRELAQSGQFQWVGADLRHGPKVDVCCNAAQLPFNSGIFDVILLSEVIEHVPDPQSVLAELRRVLKENGMIYITWPFIYNMHEVPFDFQRFTEFGIANMADVCDLELVRLVRRGNALVVLISLFEFFFFGIMELMLRPLHDNNLIRWLRSALAWVFKILYKTIITCAKPKSCKPGEHLHGAVGHLRLWNLGYCAVLIPRSLKGCA